jgi:putative resolvase
VLYWVFLGEEQEMADNVVSTGTVDRADRESFWHHVLADTFAPVQLEGLATARRGVIICQRTYVLMSVVKLRQWAAREGVHYQTAWRWWRDGKLPVPARQTATGTIVVEVPAAGGVAAGLVVSARVSSHDQGEDLGRQVAQVTECVTGQGLAVAEVVGESGSGLNGTRPELRRILPDPSAAVIVVEHRDRLARFGVEHLDAALAAQGRRVLVAGPGERADDLVRDMIEVLTSMCARLYGRRGARNRALGAVTAVTAVTAAGVDAAG